MLPPNAAAPAAPTSRPSMPASRARKASSPTVRARPSWSPIVATPAVPDPRDRQRDRGTPQDHDRRARYGLAVPRGSHGGCRARGAGCARAHVDTPRGFSRGTAGLRLPGSGQPRIPRRPRGRRLDGDPASTRPSDVGPRGGCRSTGRTPSLRSGPRHTPAPRAGRPPGPAACPRWHGSRSGLAGGLEHGRATGDTGGRGHYRRAAPRSALERPAPRPRRVSTA